MQRGGPEQRFLIVLSILMATVGCALALMVGPHGVAVPAASIVAFSSWIWSRDQRRRPERRR
jgi:hypothetical protein